VNLPVRATCWVVRRKRKDRGDCRLARGRTKRRHFWSVVLEHVVSQQECPVLRTACRLGDVDVSLRGGPFVVVAKSTLQSEGVTSMTMAYVLLIHLMVICPLIRLLSISMKERGARRLDHHLRVLASMPRQGSLWRRQEVAKALVNMPPAGQLSKRCPLALGRGAR